jgi:hypothetical protein
MPAVAKMDISLFIVIQIRSHIPPKNGRYRIPAWFGVQTAAVFKYGVKRNRANANSKRKFLWFKRNRVKRISNNVGIHVATIIIKAFPVRIYAIAGITAQRAPYLGLANKSTLPQTLDA